MQHGLSPTLGSARRCDASCLLCSYLQFSRIHILTYYNNGCRSFHSENHYVKWTLSALYLRTAVCFICLLSYVSPGDTYKIEVKITARADKAHRGVQIKPEKAEYIGFDGAVRLGFRSGPGQIGSGFRSGPGQIGSAHQPNLPPASRPNPV